MTINPERTSPTTAVSPPPGIEFSDEITDLGADALDELQIGYTEPDDAAFRVLQAAGPALIAAELRALAEEEASGCEAYIADGANDMKRERCRERLAVVARLRARAAELDPNGDLR